MPADFSKRTQNHSFSALFLLVFVCPEPVLANDRVGFHGNSEKKGIVSRTAADPPCSEGHAIDVLCPTTMQSGRQEHGG